MKRSENRILTTHVGSLIRPRPLLQAGEAAAANPSLRPQYESLLSQAVSDVVARQKAVGLDIVSDGEFGKDNWANYVIQRLTGFEIREHQLQPARWLGSDLERFPQVIEADFPGLLQGRPTEACVAPITYTGVNEVSRDLRNLKAALAEHHAEGFFTVVAPASTAYDGVNEYYASEQDYVFALAEALREEYQAVYRAGITLQVDDAVLANMYDALVRESPERYREWASLRIEALNHALAGIPPECVRYHVCFGSWHVPHLSDAELPDIIDLVLKVRAGAYSIEAANPRHEHEWRVWEERKLPEDRILIPGVITHHTITVEHPRLVADRIIRFARLVGRENVIAGADCGFAQTNKIQRVPEDVMWAKFEALAEGARLASAELWG